jgi:hypothetical protein
MKPKEEHCTIVFASTIFKMDHICLLHNVYIDHICFLHNVCIYICFGDLMHFHYQKINFFVPCYIEIYYFQMKFISSFFFFFLTTKKKMSPCKPYNTFKMVCNKLKMPQQPKLFKIQMTMFYSSFQL